MTKLNYKRRKDYYELDESSYSEADEVVLNLEGAGEGVILISERYLTLKDGRVRADLSRLSNGKITPSLINGDGVFALEPFLKQGGKILPADTEEWVVRRLLERVSVLESSVKELGERIDEINLELGVCRLAEPQ